MSSTEGDGGDTAGFPREPGMVSFVSLFWPTLKSQQQTAHFVWESLTQKAKNAFLPSTDAAERGKITARAHHVKYLRNVSLSWCHTFGSSADTLKRLLEALWGLVQPLPGGVQSKGNSCAQAHHNRGLDLALYPLGLQAPMKTFHLWPRDFVWMQNIKIWMCKLFSCVEKDIITHPAFSICSLQL